MAGMTDLELQAELKDWAYVVETLWTMPYALKAEWLSLWPDMETAKREADRLRDGMVAT